MEVLAEMNDNMESKQLVYSTRFGDVVLREDRLISFPEGLLGFGDCTTFGLSRIPNAADSPLMLLQCVNDPEVCFIVADPTMLGVDIKQADRDSALKATKMPNEATQFLTIMTLYDQGDSYYMTANTKAPVMIDSMNRKAIQYILESKEYTTQHKV